MTKIITIAIVVVLGLGVGFYILSAKSAGDAGTLEESVVELTCGDQGVCPSSLGSAVKDDHHADMDHCPGQGDDANAHPDCVCKGDPSACTDDMKAACEEAASCGDDAGACTPEMMEACTPGAKGSCELDKSADDKRDACAGATETCCKLTKGSGDSN